MAIQDDPEAGLALASKAVERRPELKVLYTSDQGVTDGMQALFVKNSAFLPKPYTVDQLTGMLLVKFGFGGDHRQKIRSSCTRLEPVPALLSACRQRNPYRQAVRRMTQRSEVFAWFFAP